jgi:hypothetical protein
MTAYPAAMTRLRLFTATLIICLLPVPARAQSAATDPHITTWLTARSAQYARIYETASAKNAGTTVSTWPSSGLTNGGGGQATAAYADIQRVAYSANYVYVYTTGLASYTMGNWLTPNGNVYTSWPSNRGAIQRIPRNPSIPSTKQKTNGNGGVWINGVFLWENGDAQSYTTSTATVSMGGQGIWNRLAGVAEAFNFDTANGHQPNSGVYHNHINPIALRYQLGDNVSYNSSTKAYSEAGTPNRHSPILGWANDGLPVYGPYGYSSALDSTSGIRRMTSGFQKRDGTNGSTNLAVTGRTTLPVWAASVQGISQTLPSTEYGPTVTATYSVAPGVTGTYSLGTFAEDYDYMGDLGKTQGVDFDLNRQNVRYCVTPEYPGGTYAYFVSIDASGNTAFPDVINQEYFGTAAIGTGTVTSISEAVTEYVDAGPAAAITVTAAASGSGVALSWNSAEGATYKVEASADNATWATLSSAVTSGGITTGYAASTATTYYRVTLTAMATYDTSGTYGTPVGKTGTVTYGTVVTAPSITTQPAAATVTAGASVTFTVVAAGTAPLSYQWSKGGIAISGATSASYAIANAQAANAGSYTCTVTNSAGSATSNAAVLTVNSAASAPGITTQPAGATVTVGGTATFTVVASGTAPLSYQWSKGGVAISGATSATYALTNVQAANAGSYTCTVTNSAGSVTTTAAVLTVSTTAVAPGIATQPAGATVTVGGNVTFTVAANGSLPLTYQWYVGGVAISGATSASYTIASVQAANAGSYTCTVTNSVGSATSSAAVLTVGSAAAAAPSITGQPAGASVGLGGSVILSVVADGSAPLSYQWYKDNVSVAGATAASYFIASVRATDAGNYVCVVRNSLGSQTSSVAVVAVNTGNQTLTVSTQPQSQFVNPGVTVTFNAPSVSATAFTGVPVSYQWKLNGSPINGAVNASFSLTNVQAGNMGFYSVAVNSGSGLVDYAPVILTVDTGGTSRLVNVSTRGLVQAGGELTPGFIVGGTGTKNLLIRAIGPTLAQFSVPGVLSDPRLDLIPQGSSSTLLSNDNWGVGPGSDQATLTATFQSVGAFPLTAGSADSAVVASLASAGQGYTARVVPGGTAVSGIALAEVYDADALTASSFLYNVSTLGYCGTGAEVLTPGFVIGGTAPKQLLIRASGPTIAGAPYNVQGTMADPQINVIPLGQSFSVGSSDNWGDNGQAAAMQAIFTTAGAFPFLAGSKDAALVVRLPPGGYTVVVSGVNSTTGVVLVEVYDLDPAH